jgi:Zn-dependent protease with chaperone function
LIVSVGTVSLLSVVARWYAFPKRLEVMIAGTFPGSTVSKTFSELSTKMGVRGVDLREAIVGNAFSLDSRGRKIVAISPDLVDSMSSFELEAVLAHEISHLKNNDSRQKGLARLTKLAFAFDPVAHLVEAAVHRERELLADRSSVKHTQRPLALASALLKVHAAFPTGSLGPGTGSFAGHKGKGLLSKYPDLERRVQLLIDMARQMRAQSIPA